MQSTWRKRTEKYRKACIRAGKHRRIAGVLCVLALVLTLGLLVRPAATLEKETVCGKEEHRHSESCYSVAEDSGEKVLTCKKEEHTHTAECYPKEEKKEPEKKVQVQTAEAENTPVEGKNEQATYDAVAEKADTAGKTDKPTEDEADTAKTETVQQPETSAVTEEKNVADTAVAPAADTSATDINTDDMPESAADEAVEAAPSEGVAVQEGDGDAVQVTGMGLDITDNVTKVVLKKKEGVIWKESTEFTTDDSVQSEITFSNLNKEELKTNGNKAYIQLPEGFACQKFAGMTFDTYDNGEKSGTYVYEKGADGRWYIVLQLKQDYLDKTTGKTIGGNLKLEFQWNKDSASEDGSKTTISLGSWQQDITIKPGQDSDSGQTGNTFGLQKTAGDLSYSEDGKTGYIDYTVTLTVKKDTTGPLSLTDTLTGNGWAYVNDSLAIAGNTTQAIAWADDGSLKTISVGNSGETIPAGTYTITYCVENTQISQLGETVDGVANTIRIPDGNSDLSDTKTKTFTTTIVDKTGSYTAGEDGSSYVDYTVYINSGDIVKDLPKGTTFSDTLPADLELVGDVTVDRYDVAKKLLDTVKADVKGNMISYTTRSGQYYYVIHYRTKLRDGVNIPIGKKKIDNTASVNGDIKGSSKATVEIPNPVLNKKFVYQNVKQQDGKWIDIIQWESKIDTTTSLKNYVYEDWSGLNYINNQSAMYMTEAQRAAIKVLDAYGNVLDTGLYRIEKSTHMDNGAENGLYRITFTGDVTGPVTIQYETTADMTSYSLGSWIHFTNYALVTGNDGTDTAWADTNQIQYNHGDPKKILKYGNVYNTEGSQSVTIKPGETSIPWTIAVNSGNSMTTDLDITDTIADGMTLEEDTLQITVNSGSILAQTEWTYDKTTGVLQIHIPTTAYIVNGYSCSIIISYRTKLPEDFFKDDNVTASFTNTATLEENGTTTDSSFTQDVTRQTVGKSGSYDAISRNLRYEIILNPDASELNEGNPLTITDTLSGGDLQQYIELTSLKLFTALKTTDASGQTNVEPGKLVRQLTEGDGSSLYTYKWNKTSGEFSACVPDKTAYVLVVEYTIEADVTTTVPLSNTVTLSGDREWSAKDDKTSAKEATSGSTYQNQDAVCIYKRDAAQYSTLLNGAVFQLDSYGNSTWTKVKELTTGKNENNTEGSKGIARTTIQRGVLYRITETTAPEEYIRDGIPYYFIVQTKGTSVALPESIDGDAEYSKDKVHVVEGEAGGKKFVTVKIDRYNAQDTTIVKAGQLRVNKAWLDADGTTVTDTESLRQKPEVTVTLKKYAPETYTVTFKGTDSGLLSWSVAKGSTVVISGWSSANSFALASGNANIVQEGSWSPYTIKVQNIQSDCIVNVSGGIDASWFNGLVSVDTTNASTDIVESIVSAVTLNDTNDWTYLWTDLDLTEGITYAVTEEAVDGYETTYHLDGQALEAGTAFALGSSGNKVLIENKASASYTLPETGGAGTAPYRLPGLLLILIAAGCGFRMYTRRHLL